MISNNRADYSSADEWLSALKQDELWQTQLLQLQNSTSTDASTFRDRALEKIGKGETYGFWDSYNHQVGPVVREVWEIAELSLSKLKIQTIGMLSMEWMEQQDEKRGLGNNSIQLPQGLDTPRARDAFAKAMEKQYMETADDGKYRWKGTGDKPNTSELAYFLGRVYNYKHSLYGNVGEKFPEDSLNELFGVTRLYSSLTQVYNAKRKQRWRSLIDDIFGQGDLEK